MDTHYGPDHSTNAHDLVGDCFPHREADARHVMQVELLHELVQVRDKGVIIAARSRLAGLAVPRRSQVITPDNRQGWQEFAVLP
jgi:hypothetical protein